MARPRRYHDDVSDVVYLDVCCLKRPFDDQRQSRVQLETTAVAALVGLAERGAIRLVRSAAHTLENERNPREDRRLAAAIWLGAASVDVPFREAIAARARQLEPLGFGPLDALHTAYAEEAGARWLVTTDDRLQSLGTRHRQVLRVEILGPIQALEASERGGA
jgi:predicted nucleic acid-binding protein